MSSLDDAIRHWLQDGEKEPLAWDILCQALRTRQCILSAHKNGLFVFCPHVLGHGLTGRYVLAFLTLGELALTREPYDSPWRWRWFAVQDFRAVNLGTGAWHGAPRATRPPFPGLTVDLDVDLLD